MREWLDLIWMVTWFLLVGVLVAIVFSPWRVCVFGFSLDNRP
jgi:hypothetical protein